MYREDHPSERMPIEDMSDVNIEKTRLKGLKTLQKRLGYDFKDIGLLNTALTHSSYANEKGMARNKYNERLEFLGDAVLQMTASEYLYNRFKECSEGVLTKIRASLVMGQTLGTHGVELGLGSFLRIGKGEELSGGRERISIITDAFEAVIGAVYLDGGYPAAKDFIVRYIDKNLTQLMEQDFNMDSKTLLQESVQSAGDWTIEYKVISQHGPDHDKTYHVRVYVNNKARGEGLGKSKKEAEQKAAKTALERLKEQL